MEQLESLITELITSETLTYAIISNVRSKQETAYTKVTVKPVTLKQQLHYQFTFHYAQKVLHENYGPNEAANRLSELLSKDFKQGMLHTQEADFHILISKKFKVTILKKPPTKTTVTMEHNRKKNYVIEEGQPVGFLIELGVMNAEGRILAKKYDKFRQINRFLEMIDDVLPYLRKDRRLNIIDFGCGKSYLTFALYHYLHDIIGLDINIVGLDLKKDVISHCNALTEKLNYDSLRFLVGDISQYDELQQVDMVVTLHACDTATDAALEKAVRWDADVILSVPCCQHELFGQIENSIMSPMLNHGIIKERFSALATDSIRAQLLDIVGYRTQILEFIDMEHTPKNLLIRAVKNNQPNELNEKIKAYYTFKQFLHIDPYLERALSDILKSILEKSDYCNIPS